MSDTCIQGGEIYRKKTSPYSNLESPYVAKVSPYSHKTADCTGDFILLETGFYMLLETGDKFKLQ